MKKIFVYLFDSWGFLYEKKISAPFTIVFLISIYGMTSVWSGPIWWLGFILFVAIVFMLPCTLYSIEQKEQEARKKDNS